MVNKQYFAWVKVIARIFWTSLDFFLQPVRTPLFVTWHVAGNCYFWLPTKNLTSDCFCLWVLLASILWPIFEYNYSIFQTFVYSHEHNVILAITFPLFKAIPLCKIVRSTEIDISIFFSNSYVLKQLFLCFCEIPVKRKKKVLCPKKALNVWFDVSWKQLHLHDLFLYFLNRETPT